MFRIDSEGATLDNKFTEGDPSLGVPATVVSSAWLNSVQEELSGFIEYSGLTLDKNSTSQLQAALLEFFLRGGRAAPLEQALANNQSPTSVAGFTLPVATVKCKICIYDLERKTDSVNKQESGLLFITRNTAENVWRLSKFSLFDDDAGVTLSVDEVTDPQVGQLQYETDEMEGASYQGKLKVTSIFEIRA